ncbi:unnamed protein product [Paramecium primaurelia]|uniref:Uncharacterized protein n=1 Tax=Paramecium primaurelia TaxID=5886 RepID=A0A8S1PZG7_PARPR|nr:unnamed protein product [Paramecium primaurelia]
MQKLTLEKQINHLEREIQQKQYKVEELTKIVDQQSNFVQQTKTQIKNLQDTQNSLQSQLFDIKQERDTFKCLNEIKEKQIKSLQEQVLIKNHVADTQQLKHELQEQYNQVFELQIELKTTKNQLEHLELERQNLMNELKIKTASQVVYIQNDFNNQPLQNYDQYLDKFDEERKQYLRQIHQYQIHEDKIKIENQKRLDKLQSIINNNEEEKRNLQEELLYLKQMIEMYKNQAQEEFTNQRKYEEQKLQNEREMKVIIHKKDKLISDQKIEIQKLHQRINNSPQMSLQTINDMYNVNVDDLIDLKMKIMKQENTIKQLQNQIAKEQLEKKNIQEQTQKELSIASEKEQECLQQIAFVEQQRQKLDIEIQQNKQLKEDIFKLQAELTQLKKKDQIQKNEIDRLRQENLNNQTYIVNSQSKDNQSSINQQIMLNYEFIKSPNIKQFEKLTQDNLNLKQIINKKDEEIIILQQKITNQNLDNEQDEFQKNSTITIAKKIEKIKSYSQKQSQMLADYRKLKLEKNKYEFQIEEFKYEIQKLRNLIQQERAQKEFMEKNLNKYKEEFSILEGQNKKQKKDFENKIKQIQQEMESKFVSKEQINYYQQNQELLKQKQQDKQLIQELKEKITNLNLDSQKYREELFLKDNQIQKLQIATDNEENQNVLQMKLQIENDKIIIQTLNERIINLNQEIESKEKQLLTFQQDQVNLESLQQFSKQIEYENRTNLNNQEDINDLKNNIRILNKKISEQTQQYQQAITEFGKEFQQSIMLLNDEIKQLEQENQDLAKVMEQYKQLYQKEKIENQNKLNLTSAEIQQIKISLEQVTKERDQLSQQKQIIDYKEQQILIKEDEIKCELAELNEEKKNFEIDLLVKKNKELSIIGCDYILIRELENYKQKLIEEQEKVNELMQRSIQQMEEQQEGNQDLYEQKLMQNELNDLKKQIEQMKAEQLKLLISSNIQIEEQLNFEEERQQYQQQIKQLMHFKENLTLEDIKLVRDIIQSGKLISYLEKAKQIHELQNSIQS